MQTVQKSEQHVPALDAVRGLAILLVLLIHIGENLPANGNRFVQILRALSSSCWVGVDLFFVLSGFLITGILYDTRSATNFFKAFYGRRFLRIFPLYYGFLFLLIILTRPLQIDWHGRQLVYLFYLQNTHIAKNVFSVPFSPYFNVDYLWSLAVEEQFYLVWPAMVFLIKDRTKLIGFAILLMTGSLLIRLLMLHSHSSFWMIYIFTPARADSLMMGAVLALLFRHGGLKKRLRPIALFCLPVCVLILVLFSLPTHGLNFSSKQVASVGYTLIALASASVITLSLTSIRFERAINWSIMRWLGRYSYGIYILHLPIMFGLMHLGSVAGFIESHPNGLAGVLIATACVVPGVAAAFISYNLYESRLLGLKNYFRYSFPGVIRQPEAALPTCSAR